MDVAQFLIFIIGLTFCLVWWVEYRVRGLRRENEELAARIAELEGRLGRRN